MLEHSPDVPQRLCVRCGRPAFGIARSTGRAFCDYHATADVIKFEARTAVERLADRLGLPAADANGFVPEEPPPDVPQSSEGREVKCI